MKPAAVAKKAKQLKRLEVEYVPIDALKPNPYNPNRQNEHDFELLLQWLGVPVHPTYELATVLRRKRAQASADIADQPGRFRRGGLLLVNPESGKVLAITLWEDEQDMQATDEASHWFRVFGADAVEDEHR